jgi:hypothetical protein
MADPTVTQLASSTSAVASTAVTFTAQPAGTLLVLVVGADAYKTGDPSGWTLPTGGAQQTNLGHYMWYKVATGAETSVTYTLGSAVNSVYWLGAVTEIDSSGTTLDISNGALGTDGSFTGNTPTVSTTTGRRFALATLGGAQASRLITGIGGWTNGYTECGDNRTSPASGTQDAIGMAYLVFDGGGTTSTAGTWTGDNADKNTGIIAVFKSTAASALSVNAGADQSIFTGQSATLTAVASGGSGTKTYAWTKISGPSGTFGSASSASTSFTPSAAGTYNLRITVTDTTGSATDDVQVICTDPSASATVASVTTSTSWTVVPSGTALAALSDTSGATYVQSAANPTNQVLEVVLEPITAPGAGVDLVVTVTCDRIDSGSGTITAQLYEGGSASGTLRSTVSSLAVPAGTDGTDVVGTVTVTFPAADVANVSSWVNGLSIKFTATAAV